MGLSYCHKDKKQKFEKNILKQSNIFIEKTILKKNFY